MHDVAPRKNAADTEENDRAESFHEDERFHAFGHYAQLEASGHADHGGNDACSVGIEADVRAEVFALPPGHPYLRLPLQFATALEARLLSLVDATELERLRHEGELELKEPGRWGTTFTLLQSWGRRSP